MKEIKKSKMIKNLHPKKSKTSFLDAAKTNSLEKTDYENTHYTNHIINTQTS